MKRKFLLVLLAVVMTVACAFGLAACGMFKNNDSSVHEHDYFYLYDEAYHWLECYCGDEKDKTVHELEEIDGRLECPVCGYASMEFQLNEEESGYTLVDILYPNSREVAVPSTFNGLPVTGIGDSAFSVCTELTSVTIPDSVASIGRSAFQGCTGLTSVTIPDSMTSIGDCAFQFCESLTSVNIPNSVECIGESAFANCYNLTNVTIGSGVTTIGAGAFFDCDSLTTITIPFVGAEKDGTENTNFSYIFGVDSDDLPSSLKTVVITGGTTIDESAFFRCYELTSIVLPDSVTEIGREAFCSCSELRSITIPSKVTSIGENAFAYCNKLTTIYYNAENASISSDWDWEYYGAFCHAGREGDGIEVIFGDSVRSIPEYLFYVYLPYSSGNFTPNITSVTIGKNVTAISWGAFQNCDSLTSVYYQGDISDWCCNITGLNNLMSYDPTLYINGQELVGELEIPDGVREIENSAFRGCNKLTGVSIPNSITQIKDSAFYGCAELTNITIPASVTSIGSSAFRNCTELTSITIPDSVTSIGSSAFYGCAGLTSVSIPDSVTDIESSVFYGCTGLTGITIPDSVTNIGNSVFYGCTGLTSITIPNSITSIGRSAFSDCTGLTKIYYNAEEVAALTSSSNVFYNAGTSGNGITVIFGDAVKSIPDYLFYNCTKLTKIAITDSVTSIGSSAFYGCAELTNITIPNSVTSIGDRAFYNCSGLTSITIPDSVTSIGTVAFDNCYKLVEVYNQSGLTLTPGNNGYGYVAYYAKNVYTQEEDSWLTDTADGYRFLYDGEKGYLLGYYGTATDLTLPDSFTAYDGTEVTAYEIYQYAFYNCSGLTSVTIPKSVTSIGNYAFYNCTGLTSVTIGNGVTSIGYRAFYNCTGLTEIYYNAEEVTDLTSSSDVFYNAGTSEDGITVIFGDTVKSIPAYLFYSSSSFYHSNIIDVTIGNNVTRIGDHAFYGCIWLTSITIGNGVTSIGDSAFYNCSELTSINVESGNTVYHSDGNCLIETASKALILGCKNSIIPTDGSVTSIGDYAFNNCTGLTSITIPNGVTSIGYSAFYNCTGLTSITIPDSVTSIGRFAFSACTKLTSVTIPDSVTSIGDYAFYGCTKLTSVMFKNTTGWWYSSNSTATSGTSIASSALANASTAATYLTDTYVLYYWKRT